MMAPRAHASTGTRHGYHEKARLGAGDVSAAVAAPSPSKRAKIIATDVKHATTCGDDDAPCFDWREATREPTADDLTAALREFEARHPSRAALAFSVFSVDAAPAQNAVRPTALTDAPTDCVVQACQRLLGELASLQALMEAVPDEHHLCVLEHITSCVREGSETEVQFECGLSSCNGNLISAQLIMKCNRVLGALVVGVVSA